MIRQIENPQEKQQIVRNVLESLPEWFGIPEATEQYIKESADQVVFVSSETDGSTLGFLALKETGRDTVELAVLGVKKPFHRRGVGRAMFEAAYRFAKESGYSFLQVKTVQTGRYPEYDETNAFYRALGFREFEVIPDLWGEANPCQIYVMAIV